MKLRRIPNPRGWTSIPTRALADDQISFRALGILVYLLSRPDGWETDSVRLAAPASREGRDAVRTALAELEQRGYLHRVKVRRPAGMTLDGRYVGGQITTEYFVSDHPVVHPSEVVELVDELPADPAAEAGDWKPVPGAEGVENSGENVGTTEPPAPGKPTPENPAPLTSPEEPLDPSSQGDPTTALASAGENSDAGSAGALSPALAPLAEELPTPFGVAVSSTRAIEEAGHLEPRVQMFALRAHLVDVFGSQPPFDLVLDCVERAHESAVPSRRGRLTNADVIAYVVATSSPPELESSGLTAAAPPAALTGGESPAWRPGEPGGTGVPNPAGKLATRLGGLDG